MRIIHFRLNVAFLFQSPRLGIVVHSEIIDPESQGSPNSPFTGSLASKPKKGCAPMPKATGAATTDVRDSHLPQSYCVNSRLER